MKWATGFFAKLALFFARYYSLTKLFNSVVVQPLYLLDQLGLDYRPEVIAARLLAVESPKTPLERLIFKPTGSTSRPYTKDVSAPQLLAAEDATASYVLFNTPREGLYDQLPPFLFHAIPVTNGPVPDTETTLEQLRQERVVEQETRRFFLPFDTELYYLRLLRYERERQADQLAESPKLREEFAEGWPILHRLDPPTASLFIQILPFIHQLRGNLPWLGQLLVAVFGIPMRFEAEQPIVHQATDAPSISLGQCRLGVNALIGGEFSDGYNAVHLHLGPVPANRVAEFLPASDARALLEELLNYFMPATIEVRLFVTVERPSAGAPVEETSAPATLYLGYNSFLTGGGASNGQDNAPEPAEETPTPAPPATYFLTTRIMPVIAELRQYWPAWSRRLDWTV
jgi:type VI secretion system protein ImpH